MTKAWDFQDLVGRVKAKALPIAAMVAGDIIDWTGESLQMNENGIIKGVGVIVAGSKAKIVEEINKALANQSAKALAGEVIPQAAQDIV